MSVNEDFHHDSRPLVADSITGTRSFAVDKLGRLTGLHYKKVWRPGLNEAKCSAEARVSIQMHAFQQSLDRMVGAYGGGPTAQPSKPERLIPADHKPGSKGCRCGYWAYFDGSDDYHDGDSVTAVVRGEGVVTVGSKGFRAEKAEIVALVDPTHEPEAEAEADSGEVGWSHRAFDAIGDYAREHRWASILAAGLLPGAMFCTAYSLWHLNTTAGLVGLAVGLALLLASGVALKAELHSIDRHYPEVSPELKCHASAMEKYGKRRASFTSFMVFDERERIRPERWNAVKRNYPDVPVYPTLADALAHHPLTPPPAPEPVTPDNTPDFWEREATA